MSEHTSQPEQEDGEIRTSSLNLSGADEKTQESQDADRVFRKEKIQGIERACESKDIRRLAQFAISRGGFLNDQTRSKAWSILLGLRSEDENSKNESSQAAFNGEKRSQAVSWQTLPRHRDEDQVRLDVDRSFVYYPSDDTQTELDTKKVELSDLITEVLRTQPWLCYFQGYHDICQVFLLVLPQPLRAPAVARLSGLRIRDFMLPNLAPSLTHLRLIPELLYAVDPGLCRHLSSTEPYFALSDTLTMFAHNIQQYSDIARLFDALLAREQVFTPYIFAQIVLDRRDELFDLDEPDMLHFTLSKPPQNLDIDSVIAGAAALFEKYPPESLRGWRSIPRSSVLKTARDVEVSAAQSLEEGHEFFEQQLADLQWEEKKRALKKYDTWQNRTAVFTLLVGVAAAVYMRKNAGSLGLLADLF